MRRALAVLTLAAVVCIGVPAEAVTWMDSQFTYISDGAVSYSDTGSNVVVSGGAFYEKITGNGLLGVQRIHGDGIDNPVSGNFALYGEVSYTDSGALAWAATNPTSLFGLEVRLRDVEFGVDLDGDNINERDNLVLDANDIPGVSYLTATFNELAAPGYTEVGPGVWLDLFVSTIPNDNRAAISVVIENFPYHVGVDVEADIIPGALEGPTAGHYVGSGMRITPIDPVPEPITMITASFGLLGLGRYVRRRISV